MIPKSPARKPKNSSKVNLIISLAFHGVLVFVILYFAARGGILGEAAKKFVVTVEHKPKPPEVKPKEVEKPPDAPKETPKMTIAPKITPTQTATAPAAVAPAAAPPAVDLPSFFDGGRDVTTADAVTVYKTLIQSSLTARWQRPDMGDKDKDYVAEVQVSVDPTGRIGNPVMTKPSGNKAWDDSISKAIVQASQLTSKPPPGFPGKVTVRFDVAEDNAGPLMP